MVTGRKTIKNARRYVDAVQGRTNPMQALFDLAQMLDNAAALQKQQDDSRIDNALVPQQARGVDKCRVGTLILVNPNGTITRADRPTNQLATGVVVKELGGQNYMWSIFAVLWLLIPDASPAGQGLLYLANDGLIQATQPTEGTAQRVGFQVNYDSATQKTLAAILPGISTFLG